MTRDHGSSRVEGGPGWRTLLLALVAGLGVFTLLALVVTLGGANRKRDEALRAQAHSYDVMILARSLAGTIARSEASLGRYVISSDRQLGQLYFDEWTLAATQIDRLETLTRDNGEQQARIDRLRTAFHARGTELSTTALSTNYGKNRQAFARFYQSRRAPTLAAINRALDGIIRRERALLDSRTREAARSVEQSSKIAGGLAVFGLLLVIGAVVLGWLTVRAIGDRAEAQAQADAERERAAELAVAVADATEELRQQEAKLRQVQKMQAIGELTGGIAHDFNNMLAVVIGGLELARRHIDDDRTLVRRHLDSAREGADRAAALTRRLLAFSREESLKPEPLDPAALVAGMTDLLDRTLGDGVELVVRDDGGDWRLLADRLQLENAILNLAVNARDAMNERGTLTIAIGGQTRRGGERPGEWVTIAVADTGCGMTAEVAERVFEPFFTTKEAGRGTGLGLSQVFALVDQLGGWIGIDTAPDMGTTVTVHFPRYAGAATTGSAAVAAMPVRPAGPLTVLVVEDDPRVLATTTGALADIGHRPIACDDPLAVPAMLDGHRDIGLIITDVLMPRQTGPEMIAGLPAPFRDLPVLFVTGYAGETAAEALDGRHVLRKPFTLAGLERAIAAATAAGGADQLAAE